MIDLFISTISSRIYMCLLEKNSLLRKISINNKGFHSDNFSYFLKRLLKEKSIRDIKKIYFLFREETSSGLRVSLSFIIAFLSLKKVEVFYINCLLFQCKNPDCISSISLGEKKKVFYTNIYKDYKIIASFSRINFEENERILKEYNNFKYYCDFSKSIDLFPNFLIHLKLKNYKKMKNIKELFTLLK